MLFVYGKLFNPNIRNDINSKNTFCKFNQRKLELCKFN
jgi:hypothetical protein